MNDLKVGTVISRAGEPFEILSTQHVQMGRGSAVLRTKIKGLVSGKVLEETYKSGDKFKEANLTRSRANFQYTDGKNYFFMDNENYEQFSLPQNQIGEISHFVAEGSDVEVLNFEGSPVMVKLPPKVELKVTSAPPGVRGNTAQGNVTKQVTLETGYVINAPLFIKEGDTIRVNTESGEYVERA